MQLAYLYSRYPVVSQTFCDMEMLELERRGYDLVIGSVHPPLTSLRHAGGMADKRRTLPRPGVFELGGGAHEFTSLPQPSPSAGGAWLMQPTASLGQTSRM